MTYPAGPKGLRVFSYVGGGNKGRLAGWGRLLQEYGDLIYAQILGKDYYLLNHPDLIKAVLVDHNDDLAKIQIGKKPARIPDVGAVTADKAYHRQMRKLLQPAFQPAKLAPYTRFMIDHTATLLDMWKTGDVVDVSEAMTSLTLTIVGQALFSADMSNKADSMGESVRVVAEYLAKPSALPLPTRRNIGALNAWMSFDKIIKTIIKERQASQTYPDDLLSVILQSVDNTDGFRLTDEQAHGLVIALFVAGHETTAIALAWTFELLARHPHIQEALYHQIKQVAGDAPLSADMLPNIPLADFVVREAMRLYPPAWALVRQVAIPFDLRGYTIPTGAILLMSPYIMGHDARFFPSPNEFMPQRWENADDIPRYAYFPFGGGVHVCIGQFFAMLEAQLIVTMVVQRFSLAPMRDTPTDINPLITLHPALPIHLRVVAR
ncbi:MAG: cytochrome P450 [bacterium]|nr:cytochrome P450 [bacterium]